MKITLPIAPVGQMRPRATIARGHARVHKAKKQESREYAMMSLLAPHKPAAPMTGPILLGVRAYLPIPVSKSKAWKAAALAGQVRPTSKPDLDNLLKHVKDCLTTMGFWGDDAQVVGYLPGTGKHYSAEPRWEIEIVGAESANQEEAR